MLTSTAFAVRSVPLATIERINRERTISLARYEEDGFFDRFGYLASLAQDHGLAFGDLLVFADLLGAAEDFDGLVSTLEDLAC